MFNRGIASEFTKNPNQKNLKKFLKSQVKLPSTLIDSESVMQKVQKRKLAIAYFGQENDDFKQFLTLDRRLRGLKLYHSFEESYVEKNGGQPGITLFRRGNEPARYTGEITHENILKWLKSQM